MDVDRIVAWWLQRCMQREMTIGNLVAALRELQGDVCARSPDSQLRLDVLTRAVADVVATGDIDQARIESLAVDFLGTTPSAVLATRGTPDWNSNS